MKIVHLSDAAFKVLKTHHPVWSQMDTISVGTLKAKGSGLYIEPSDGVKGEQKVSYAEGVKLTQQEYKKIMERFGVTTGEKMIETLNNYKLRSGKTYKSDYHALIDWVAERCATTPATERERRNYDNAPDWVGDK